MHWTRGPSDRNFCSARQQSDTLHLIDSLAVVVGCGGWDMLIFQWLFYFLINSLCTKATKSCTRRTLLNRKTRKRGGSKAQFRRRTFHEPNQIHWIKYMKSSASESIKNGNLNLERPSRSSRLVQPGISALERLWFRRRTFHEPNLMHK